MSFAFNGAYPDPSYGNGYNLGGTTSASGYAAPAYNNYYDGLNQGYGYATGYPTAGYPTAAPAAQAAPPQLDETILAEIENRLQQYARRRQPVLRRQIISVPGAAGRVQQVVRRLPTPPPDVIERVYVEKPQRDVVNFLIERPSTPPPRVQEKRVVERPHGPVINQQVVRVAPRTAAQPTQPVQQIQPAQPVSYGYQPVGYGNQPVSYSYQPPNYGYSYGY